MVQRELEKVAQEQWDAAKHVSQESGPLQCYNSLWFEFRTGILRGGVMVSYFKADVICKKGSCSFAKSNAILKPYYCIRLTPCRFANIPKADGQAINFGARIQNAR
jgi:hypothetical protein